MDTSSVPLLHCGLQYQWCCPVSDSDVSSVSSAETLSPVPSMDSSLSPSYQQPAESTPKGSKTGYQENLKPSACYPSRPGRKTGHARGTQVRSKQRESASEKEKLRMRDLTKALHHLRTYLPPSLAPAGQTLTKIETLRLTIRYISYLSAQLGLSEEVLFQKRAELDGAASKSAAPDLLSYFQCSSTTEDQLVPLQSGMNSTCQSQYPPQSQSQPTSVHSGNCCFGVDLCQYREQYSEAPHRDVLNTSSMETSLQSPSVTQPASCQMYNKDFCSPLVSREYWG